MLETFGLSDKGFKPKNLLTIKEELEYALRNEVDASLSFGADSIAGVITAIVAHQACQVWESLGGLFHSLQPNTASGRALDALCSLTGTYRKKPAPSRAKVLLTLAAKAKVPANSRVRSPMGLLFKTPAEVVNNGNAVADIESDFVAEEFGPVSIQVNSPAEIMTPCTGWSKAVFAQVYDLGNLDEEDHALRLRRIEELRAAGASTLNAINERVKKIPGVLAVHIKEEAHSFETIVHGGKDEDIAQVIWERKPIGVGTSGKIKRNVTDNTGAPREVRFSRPSTIALKLDVHLKVKRELLLADVERIKNAIQNFSKQQFLLGAEIYSSRFFAPILADATVLDIVTLQFSPKAGGTLPIPINPDHMATLLVDDITLKTTVETA